MRLKGCLRSLIKCGVKHRQSSQTSIKRKTLEIVTGSVVKTEASDGSENEQVQQIRSRRLHLTWTYPYKSVPSFVGG